MPVRLLVCDLDGTLLKVNSFRWWVVYWVCAGWLRPGFWSCWCRVLVRRLLGVMRREDMKAELMALYSINEQRLPSTLKRLFCRLLKLMVDWRVGQFIKQKQNEGFVGILATAAPDVYLMDIIQCFGFRGAVGSYLDSGTLVETIGEAKSRSVLGLIESWGLSREECFIVALTDHSDDIPIALEVDQTVLVNPSQLTTRAFKQAGIDFEQFRGEEQG